MIDRLDWMCRGYMSSRKKDTRISYKIPLNDDHFLANNIGAIQATSGFLRGGGAKHIASSVSVQNPCMTAKWRMPGSVIDTGLLTP